MKANDVALEKDSLITPLPVGLLASAGVENIAVYRQLRVALISTGSELTPIGMAVSYMTEFVCSDYDCYVLMDEEHIHPLCGIYSKKMLD